MTSLSELINSKEFKEYYDKASKEDKEKMDLAIIHAKDWLERYLEEIKNEQIRRQSK
jgi:molecular chaperone DnaK (HSP70)